MRVEAVQSVDRMIGAHRALGAGGGPGAEHGLRVQLRQRLPPRPVHARVRQADRLRHRHPGAVDRRRSRHPGRTARNSDMAQNIDLRPTFEQLAGAATPSDVDGRSLVPLLDRQASTWRTYALVEHAHDDPKPGDPDSQDLPQRDATDLQRDAHEVVRLHPVHVDRRDRVLQPRQGSLRTAQPRSVAVEPAHWLSEPRHESADRLPWKRIVLERRRSELRMIAV